MTQLTLFNQTKNQLKQFPAQRSSPQFGDSNQKEQKPGLRPYQKSAIGEVYQLIKQGYTNPLVYAPTGSGKTVMASHIVNDAISRSRRVLFLVHRDALVKQSRDTLISYGIPEKLIGYIKAGYPHATEHHQVIVASIQSLARRDYPTNIGLIIVDECHTTAFYNDFKSIRAFYQHDGQKGAIIIGLSASPWRNKANQGMKHAGFNCLVKAANIAGLIREDYLAPPRYFGFGGLVDVSQFETGYDGDYKTSQVQSACMQEGFNERIVEEFRKLCPARTAIAFCSSLEQSRYLTQLFNDTGIVAEHLEASTPSDERQRMYERLSNGKTRILCSVGTLTEGFDVKSIGAILLARPTKSVSLYVQVCGRGLRPYSGKEDCLILDFADNVKRLGFLSEQPEPTLEPLKKKPEQQQEPKECPNCGNLVDQFLRVCPHCGYEFSVEETQDDDIDDEAFEQEFGELFDPETREKVRYFRREVKKRYTQRQPRDRAWDLYIERYNEYPNNDWLFGAVFGSNRTQFNQQQFLDYLHEVSPVQPPKSDWLRFHLQVEFGNQVIKDLKLQEGMKWYEILQVSPDADWSMIKKHYRKLAPKYHPDHGGSNDDMKLLNWAFDRAKSVVRDSAA